MSTSQELPFPANFFAPEQHQNNTIKNVVSRDISVAWIIHEEQFAALKDSWNDLADKAGSPSVFLRHEWFDAAWQWAKLSASLRILCVYRERRLIGICPLITRSEKFYKLPVRRLAFLTVPDTQRCDVICAPDDNIEVVNALAAQLQATFHEWDVFELSYLLNDSAVAQILPTALGERGLPALSLSDGQNPYIALTEGWTSFYSTRGRRLKKSNNLIANRLKKAGLPGIQRYTAAVDAQQTADALEKIIHISSASWKETTGLSLENMGPNHFIKRLTEHASREGWLSIWLLTLDGTPVAMEYQLCYEGSIHALRADFDNHFYEFSPGSYLNREMLEQLFESGSTHYFMGPGNNAYKLKWTEQAIPLSCVKGYSKSLRGRFVLLVERKLRPLVKRLLRKDDNKKLEIESEE